MTASEAIELACVLRPNELDKAALERFLMELEDNLAVEVRGEAPTRANAHPHSTSSQQLSVPSPFDRLYWAYLLSLIDLSGGDNAAYAITRALFDGARDAYARWYQRTGGGA